MKSSKYKRHLYVKTYVITKNLGFDIFYIILYIYRYVCIYTLFYLLTGFATAADPTQLNLIVDFH